ncbi:MAG: CHAT domain-containing protein [Alloprevotella sp.]|nr:CHAT domain-containing protein [Alloprevotella sp.]
MKLNNILRQTATTAVLLMLFQSLPAQTKELNAIDTEARKAVKKNTLEEAERLYQAYVDLYAKTSLEKGDVYSERLLWLARRAAQTGRLDRAIELQQDVVEIRRTAKDCNNSQYGAALSDLAIYYGQKTNYDLAIATGKEALSVIGSVFGEKHHFYNITLANIAGFYAARGGAGDYLMAIELGEKALKNIKKGTPEYANTLNALVVFYTQAGKRVEANKLSAKAIKEARKHIKNDGVEYASMLNNQAIRLANYGNYEEAVTYCLMAREIFEKAGADNTLPYSRLLTNLGTFYAHQQHFDDAIKAFEAALPIIEQSVGKQHADYVRCISDLASVHRSAGDLEKADDLAHESDQASMQLGEQDNTKYAKSLSKQARTFASNGNYNRAVEKEQKALDIYTQRKDSANMAFSLGTLANYQYANGTKTQALSTAENALNLFRQHGEPSALYAQSLNNAAILYYNSEQYEQASDYGRQAMQMYALLNDTANTIYARIKANNALFTFIKDSIEQAENLVKEALALNRRILGENHSDNIPMLYNLAVFQMKKGAIDAAAQNYSQAFSLQAEQVRTNFLHLTSQEREKYWRQKRYVFKLAPLLAYMDKDNMDLTTIAYNSLLFTKGILLNSDIDFKELLKNSGDLHLLDKYNQLETLRQHEEDYNKLPADQRDANDLKRIREEIYQLERSLVRGCKEYGTFTSNLNITAAQVASSLAEDEAAVEFTNFYLHGTGMTYAALLITKKHPAPQLIRLFSEEDLKSIRYHGNTDFRQSLQTFEGINQIYNDPRVGSLIWSPILQRAVGVRRIYFSPSALFYHLGIEYLPLENNRRIQDVCETFRVSSTKSLVNRSTRVPMQTATIYGGLNYDMTLEEMLAQRDRQPVRENGRLLIPDADLIYGNYYIQRTVDSLSTRGAVHYLQGTRHEAEDIAEELMQNGVNTTVLMDNEGTEETFKALSGTSLSLIHIATHGFSFSEQEVQKQEKTLAFLSELSEDVRNPLNYSGLLLSGVNYALQGKKLPTGLEDGILTAREIAQVDLGNVDMVVLSACQTGLGEVKEDGVFGIQRGFKKAGAHSLLMSLWKVSDEATDIMMSEFYHQLMQGHSLHESFSMAQQAVRKDPQTAAPYFWASFILLDGN